MRPSLWEMVFPSASLGSLELSRDPDDCDGVCSRLRFRLLPCTWAAGRSRVPLERLLDVEPYHIYHIYIYHIYDIYMIYIYIYVIYIYMIYDI